MNMKEIIEQIKKAQSLISFSINAVPTGSTRNLLTDANILLLSTIQEFDPEDIPDSDDFENCDDIDEEPDYDHDKEEMIEERGIEADNNRM